MLLKREMIDNCGPLGPSTVKRETAMININDRVHFTLKYTHGPNTYLYSGIGIVSNIKYGVLQVDVNAPYNMFSSSLTVHPEEVVKI